MIKKTFLEPVNILIFILSIIALAYTSYRAYVLSMTHDESFTFQYFVAPPILDIMALKHPNAGNHVLNSLFIKLFTNIFGTDQIFVRLHSLLAHAVYLLFSFLILKDLKNKILLVSGFVLLNFSPYFLDFFSLARGYAMAHAFILAATYFSFKYYESRTTKYYVFSLIFAFLAAWSQFIMLYFYAAVMLLFNLMLIPEISQEKGISSKFKLLLNRNIPTLIVLLVTIIIFFEPIRRLIKFNQLYGRGSASFWRDTVMTIAHGSLYNKMYFISEVNFFTWFLAGIFIVAGIVLLVDLIVKRKISNTKLFTIFALLCCVILVSQLHHYLGKGEYLVYRSGLFYYPLIIVTLILVLNYFHSYLKGIPVAVVALTMASSLLYHFVRSANAQYVTEWIYECNTQKMLNDVYENYHKKTGRKKDKIRIATHWTFEPTINFYRMTSRYNWLHQTNRDGFKSETEFHQIYFYRPGLKYNWLEKTNYNKSDYYYIYREDSAYLYKTGKQILKRYEFSSTILAKDTTSTNEYRNNLKMKQFENLKMQTK